MSLGINSEMPNKVGTAPRNLFLDVMYFYMTSQDNIWIRSEGIGQYYSPFFKNSS